MTDTTSLNQANLGSEFIVYIDSILKALNINEDREITNKIVEEMKSFNDNAKYKIINDTLLHNNVAKLIEADTNLNDVFNRSDIQNRIKDKDGVKTEWQKTMSQIARLQGLIILRKISENDCDGLIKSLLGAFNQKLEAVNQVLASDLKQSGQASDNNRIQTGGTNNNYLKYLKYKNKYLRLRKNNI